MWFEILPSFSVVVIAMAFPHASAYVLNKLVVGNSYRRAMYTRTQKTQYLRDARLTGSPYKINRHLV
ncbi:hypothetical protein NQ317_019207, partial [Molorchus minor]